MIKETVVVTIHMKHYKYSPTNMDYMWLICGSYTVNNGLYMVIIWLMMVNNNLVGGFNLPL